MISVRNAYKSYVGPLTLKSWQVFKGQINLGAGWYDAKTADYIIKIPQNCQIITAVLRYTVKPDMVALFGDNFWVDLNSNNKVHESWTSGQDPTERNGQKILTDLIKGENKIHVQWDKTALLTSVNFNSNITLSIEYSGESPIGDNEITEPPKPEDFLTWAMIIAAVAVVGVVGVKAYQAYKNR